MQTMPGKPLLTGVVVATVLPFDTAQEIDWHSYASTLDYCAAPQGIEAVFVNGHAGEGATLGAAERRDVLRFTRNHIAPEKRLIAGVIAQSTREAIVVAREAQAAGADMLTIFPPANFAGARTAMVVEYVRAIWEAVEMPLIMFQYPLGSGYGYSTETLLALAQLPGVIGVKEGSDTIRAYEENWFALKAARPNFAVLASNFDWFLAQLASGSDGILSGLASVAPGPLVELWQAGTRGDLSAMRAVSARMLPLVRAIYATPRNEMYARIKFALHILGVIDSPTTRSPLLPIEPATAEAIRAALLNTEGLSSMVKTPPAPNAQERG
jgi:4-hydroxy-tetrahydrodipicolinate synthase